MRAEALRAVLLVRAVEDADRDGRLLPSADRVAASRAARRAHPGIDDYQVLLAARNARLLEGLVARHRSVATMLAASRTLRWLPPALLLASLAAGFALSALDGTQRINILGFPVLGVVLWNLVVYALLLLRLNSGSEPDLVFTYAKTRSGSDPEFKNALASFARAWAAAAKPLYAARAVRVLHLAALALALGLIGGLYLRGLVLDYRAVWESTFLDAPQVHALVSVLYGPASLATGVPLPGTAELETIRARGESAARWIHLMAATVALFVVLPRSVLAALQTSRIARLERDLPVPEGLQPYYRQAFAQVETLARASVLVVPYAYVPSPQANEALRRALPGLLGGELAIELDAPTPYGDEDALLAQLEVRHGGGADVLVLLFSLATTPEDENHGVLIAGARDLLARERPRAELFVLIDEAPYAARHAGEGAARERMEERRALWQSFARARGVDARVVKLA